LTANIRFQAVDLLHGHGLDSANKTFHLLPNPLADPRWGHRATVFWDYSAPAGGRQRG